MYCENWEVPERDCPLKDGKWDKEALYEYLVWSCSKKFRQPLDDFFSRYQGDRELARLLFDFLLDDEYDGSDCQMGAAYYIAKLDRKIRCFGKNRLQTKAIWNGYD